VQFTAIPPEVQPLINPLAPSDHVAPVITAPASIFAEASSARGAIVSYPVSAADDHDGKVPVQCLPATGTIFAGGSTLLRCTAVDAAGNVATKTIPVSVTDIRIVVPTTFPDQTAAGPPPGGADVSFVGCTATDPATCDPLAIYA